MYKERQRTRKKTSLHLSSVAKSVQSLPTRTTVMQVAKEKTWSNSNQKTQQHHHKKETYLTEEKTEKSVSSSIVYSTKQSSHSSEKVTPSILWTLCPGYLMIHTFPHTSEYTTTVSSSIVYSTKQSSQSFEKVLSWLSDDPLLITSHTLQNTLPLCHHQ